MKTYDVAIIGGGAGGLNAAFEAKKLGKKVVLIEDNAPGGECTWSGCIPSKALINIADEIHTAKKYADVKVNGKEVLSSVRELIHLAHQGESVEVLKNAGIHYLHGYAKFVDATTLLVCDEKIHAKKIIIATGSKALVPHISGLEKVEYLTNETVFLMQELPKSMIVLGGGPIGVELAQAFSRLGVNVKIVEMADTLLHREEKEMASKVEFILEEEKIEIFTSYKGVEVTQDVSGIELTMFKNGKKKVVHAETLLLALGRKPNVQGMDFEKVGIHFNDKGIEVDEYLKTSCENIYAVGDVVGPYQFSHMGGVQGRLAVNNAFSEQKTKMNYDHVAWCTFTHPELARAGLSEREAKQKYGEDLQTITYQYKDLDRAVVDQKTQGMAKIICDKEGYILGASILGERACEMLGELQVLKTLKIPFNHLQEAIHPYPGYSELLVIMSKMLSMD